MGSSPERTQCTPGLSFDVFRGRGDEDMEQLPCSVILEKGSLEGYGGHPRKTDTEGNFGLK